MQFFEPVELEIIKDRALAVELSPRSTKRIVNVVKLVKNIWYRRGVPEPGESAKAAIVLLLALSAGYPEVMRRVLLELERVLHRPSRRQNLKLCTALTRILGEWGDTGVHKGDWASVTRLVADRALLDDTVTLDQIGLANVEGDRAVVLVRWGGGPPTGYSQTRSRTGGPQSCRGSAF